MRLRFTQSNLGCFLCPPEMTPSLPPSLPSPISPHCREITLQGVARRVAPHPRRPLSTSDSVLLRFTANVYWRRRHSNFALPPFHLLSGVVHSKLEVRTIVPQSIVPCSIAWTDRQTKMMGVSELCNRQPLRLEYETPRHGVHMQIANEGVEGRRRWRRRMTLPYWQSCQVLQ